MDWLQSGLRFPASSDLLASILSGTYKPETDFGVLFGLEDVDWWNCVPCIACKFSEPDEVSWN